MFQAEVARQERRFIDDVEATSELPVDKRSSMSSSECRPRIEQDGGDSLLLCRTGEGVYVVFESC